MIRTAQAVDAAAVRRGRLRLGPGTGAAPLRDEVAVTDGMLPVSVVTCHKLAAGADPGSTIRQS